MSVDYKGLIRGNISAIDIAKAINRTYGGDEFEIRFGGSLDMQSSGHYILNFIQNLPPEAMARRPWDRKDFKIHRMMHIFNDDDCACDYEEVEGGPYTYVSLGHWGECKEIVNSLILEYGGYRKDESTTDEWEKLPAAELLETEIRVLARLEGKSLPKVKEAA